PNSYLWVGIVSSNEMVQMLTFPGVTGRTYSLQMSSNILAGAWENVHTNISGPVLSNILIQINHTHSLDRVYYRIGVDTP
ncbi:MAG: hypothetical protein AAF492_13350, partial [Verrucomicrobiota bacterium]